MDRDLDSSDDDNLIPGIFNYCDRWCERCDFTARCRVFAMEAERGSLDDSDDPIGDALDVVRESFAEAKEMLIERAEEMGIDIDAAMNDPEIDASIKRTRETVESHEAVELAKDYAVNVRHVLGAPNDWAGDLDDPMTAEMLTILQWYQFFIAAKVHGSYHGIMDTDGYEDPDQLVNPQSYANGQAKISLISIERSVLAWTYLLNGSNAAVIRPWIEKLEKIKSLLETKFPNAREFVRPGFDEIEADAVM